MHTSGIPIAFCPTQCAPDQMHCGGHWEDGKQVVADTCVPNKDGNDCPGMCPVHCGENDQMCAGGKDWNDCYMGDFCYPKDCKYFLASNLPIVVMIYLVYFAVFNIHHMYTFYLFSFLPCSLWSR